MNRQGPNGIEWTDYTWNPVTGCKRGCEYCYARRIGERFDGHFDPCIHYTRLDEPSKLKKPSKIFVVSMGDLFGEWIYPAWIKFVLEETEKASQHTYQFLTKNPDRYKFFSFRQQDWLGVTAENSWPDGDERIEALLDAVHAYIPEGRPQTFVSIEPILGGFDGYDFTSIDLLIVGAMTGPNAIKPEKSWLESVIATGHPNILWKKNVRPFLEEYGLVV